MRYYHLIPMALLFVIMAVLGWPTALVFLAIYAVGFIITTKVKDKAITDDRKRQKNLPR
jgi:hypothetical protein